MTLSPRAQAHKAYAAALGAARSKVEAEEVTRRLALADLFFLLVYVLNRKDVDRDWLFARCREVQATPNGCLDLWGRFHYKSTILTFGLTIQDILRDPEITVGILSFNRPTAKAFLKQIKREFETNALLKDLFSDVLWSDPGRQSSQWSEDGGITVRRKSNPKEATVEAWGLVEGQPTARHYKLRLYDDVVTKESVTTPDMIKKVTESWELSLALTTEGGISRYVGTRYHFNDTYSTIIERGAAIARVYPATVDGQMDGDPVLLPADELRQLRKDMGGYTFACQMLLDPRADKTQGFKEEWLEYWPARNFANLNTYIICDPAHSKKIGSDYTVFMVIGYGDDDCYRVVTMIRDRLSLTERADVLFALHRDYRPLAVGYEQYGLQADIEHFTDRMARENYKFFVTPLGGKLSKPDRIRRLIPLFEQHRILIPESCARRNYEGTNEDLTKVFVDTEYKAFPVSAHDDMLDALARITDDEFPMRAPRSRSERRLPSSANHGYSPHRWRR